MNTKTTSEAIMTDSHSGNVNVDSELYAQNIWEMLQCQRHSYISYVILVRIYRSTALFYLPIYLS